MILLLAYFSLASHAPALSIAMASFKFGLSLWAVIANISASHAFGIIVSVTVIHNSQHCLL